MRLPRTQRPTRNDGFFPSVDAIVSSMGWRQNKKSLLTRSYSTNYHTLLRLQSLGYKTLLSLHLHLSRLC